MGYEESTTLGRSDMRRACYFALFTAILTGEGGLAQTKKISKDSKPAVRQEFGPSAGGDSWRGRRNGASVTLQFPRRSVPAD